MENLPAAKDCTVAELLFGETPGRLLLEVAPEHLAAAKAAGVVVIGESTNEKYLNITLRGSTLIDAAIGDLKPIWQGGLVPYY
jgi:phosphoribosylformylglycinamidine synthase